MHIIWQKIEISFLCFTMRKILLSQKKKKKNLKKTCKSSYFWGLQIIVGNYTHNVLIPYMYVSM